MSFRWQANRQAPRHTDDWLMTYADMITLLLCFFAVFLSVSIPKKDAQKKTEQPPPVEHVVQQPVPEINPPLPTLARVEIPPDEPGFISAAALLPATAE